MRAARPRPARKGRIVMTTDSIGSQVDRLPYLAEHVARRLGDGWYPGPHPYDTAGAALLHPDGRKLTLRTEWPDQDRIHVAGEYPSSPHGTHERLPRAQITVRADRGVQVLARDTPTARRRGLWTHVVGQDWCLGARRQGTSAPSRTPSCCPTRCAGKPRPSPGFGANGGGTIHVGASGMSSPRSAQLIASRPRTRSPGPAFARIAPARSRPVGHDQHGRAGTGAGPIQPDRAIGPVPVLNRRCSSWPERPW
jgi:hypothetical protein